MVKINDLNVGMLVRYIGSVEKLLNNIPERQEIEKYLSEENKFKISAIKNNGEDGFLWEKENIEIEYKSSDQSYRWFYVDIEEIVII